MILSAENLFLGSLSLMILKSRFLGTVIFSSSLNSPLPVLFSACMLAKLGFFNSYSAVGLKLGSTLRHILMKSYSASE